MADTQTQNTNETTQQNTTPNAQSPLLTGRKVIYINPMDLSVDENLIAAVEQTMLVHAENRDDMRYLKEYEKGNQPIFYRVKDIRPEINVQLCANYAKLITKTSRLATNLHLQSCLCREPRMTSAKADPKQDDKRVAMLNEMLEQDKTSKDIEACT